MLAGARESSSELRRIGSASSWMARAVKLSHARSYEIDQSTDLHRPRPGVQSSSQQQFNSPMSMRVG